MPPCSLLHPAHPARAPAAFRKTGRTAVRVACASGGSGEGGKTGSGTGDPSPGAGLKAVWVGAEAFGNMVGAMKGSQQQQPQPAASSTGPLTREQVLQSLRDDFDKNYFVSGKGEMAAYAPDCLFADPFASFRGTERFKRNVSNLGGLLSDIDLALTGWEERDGELLTKWRFRAVLDLPWRPLLAAAGGTRFVFDPASGRVVQHVESWDVEPARVVRQLLKPSAKVPATQAEVLMQALHDGDGVGAWFAVSSKVLQAALPASGMLAVLHLARGEGLGWLEAAAYVGVLAALLTEMYKVVKSIGGEGG